jgi:hypothetical protein
MERKNEWISEDNHAWDELKELLNGGSNACVCLPAQRNEADFTLRRLGVSTASYLGTIAYETGGILVDSGWVCLLGSGGEGIQGGLLSWNGLNNEDAAEPVPGMLVVAYDAAGGFFAMDTGRFGGSGQIYYFAPDTMEWENTELAYSGFVHWLANGDLAQFYETFRWDGWQEEMTKLQSGQVFSYYPPLWSKEGGGESSSKSPVPVSEAWSIVSKA